MYWLHANFSDEDNNYGPGPHLVKLTTGMTRFPFNISLDELEEHENFFLTIDRSSLPCDVNVGSQVRAAVTIREDECKSIGFDDIYIHKPMYSCVHTYMWPVQQSQPSWHTIFDHGFDVCS